MANQFPPSEIIDVTGLFDTPGHCAELDARVTELLATRGSFVATGFRGGRGNDAAARRVLDFFSLAEEEKTSIATCRARPENDNIYRGYYPLLDKQGFAYNETLDIGPQDPGTVPDIAGADGFREHTPWPAREPHAGWKQETLDYFATVHGLALAVLRAIARHTGRDEEAMVAPCRNGNGTLRLLHYFETPDDYMPKEKGTPRDYADELGRRIRTQRHIDTGVMSILWQDENGGLQMQGRDGVWREVPAVADGLSVHCGDLLKAMTGGLIEATPHRVADGGQERLSLGLFVEPDFDAMVLPPDSTTPVTYAGHLINEFPGRFERPKAA